MEKLGKINKNALVYQLLYAYRVLAMTDITGYIGYSIIGYKGRRASAISRQLP